MVHCVLALLLLLLLQLLLDKEWREVPIGADSGWWWCSGWLYELVVGHVAPDSNHWDYWVLDISVSSARLSASQYWVSSASTLDPARLRGPSPSHCSTTSVQQHTRPSKHFTQHVFVDLYRVTAHQHLYTSTHVHQRLLKHCWFIEIFNKRNSWYQ